jgi:hypothetical protein
VGRRGSPKGCRGARATPDRCPLHAKSPPPRPKASRAPKASHLASRGPVGKSAPFFGWCRVSLPPEGAKAGTLSAGVGVGAPFCQWPPVWPKSPLGQSGQSVPAPGRFVGVACGASRGLWGSRVGVGGVGRPVAVGQGMARQRPRPSIRILWPVGAIAPVRRPPLSAGVGSGRDWRTRMAIGATWPVGLRPPLPEKSGPVTANCKVGGGFLPPIEILCVQNLHAEIFLRG